MKRPDRIPIFALPDVFLIERGGKVSVVVDINGIEHDRTEELIDHPAVEVVLSMYHEPDTLICGQLAEGVE